MEEKQIDGLSIVELITLLLNRWYIVVGGVLLGFIVAYLYAYNALQNEYTAYASMIVVLPQNPDSDENYNDFNYSVKLKDTYTELAKSDLVTLEVLEMLNLTLSSDQLRSMVSVVGVSDTVVIKLTVTSADPGLSSDIANAMVVTMRETAKGFEGFHKLELLDMAKVPTAPSGPNRPLFIIIGILLGGIVGVGGILIYELLNTKIKKEQDIEEQLGIKLLSVIPKYELGDDIV